MAENYVYPRISAQIISKTSLGVPSLNINIDDYAVLRMLIDTNFSIEWEPKSYKSRDPVEHTQLFFYMAACCTYDVLSKIF
jgi:hypothetical protein